MAQLGGRSQAKERQIGLEKLDGGITSKKLSFNSSVFSRIEYLEPVSCQKDSRANTALYNGVGTRQIPGIVMIPAVVLARFK